MEADDIGKEYRIQRSFGPVSLSAPICKCGKTQRTYQLKTEAERVQSERNNEDRLIYSGVCGDCGGAKVARFEKRPVGPRPRWENYRKKLYKYAGERMRSHARQQYEQAKRWWLEAKREDQISGGGVKGISSHTASLSSQASNRGRGGAETNPATAS